MSRARRARVAIAAMLAVACTLTVSPAAAQTLARPWACGSCISNYYYFDHNAGSGVQDWHCGTSTYNGHNASDFSLSGGIAAIAGGHAVRAAADGVVIFAVDGNYDQCRITGLADCTSGTRCTYDTANYVAIRHSGRTTRYVHLRRGSVRVAVGDHVTCGQVIGEIGSSGCSTNAHLHFEVRPRADTYSAAYDPFLGTCSPRTASAWITQGSYRGYPGATCPVTPPPPVDAGVPPPDAGMPLPDAGVPPPDAGPAVEPDAGSPPPDASAGVDASIAGPDAALPGFDAAARAPDAGRPEASITGGCGCRVSGRGDSRATSLLLFACAGGWWARRKLRAARKPAR